MDEIFNKRHLRYSVQVDGRFSLIESVVRRVTANNLNVCRMQYRYYNRAIERITALNASIRRTDGTVLNLPNLHHTIGGRDASSYPNRSEDRRLMLSFKEAQVGDCIMYDLQHDCLAPAFKGLFGVGHVMSIENIEDVIIEVSSPPGIEFHVHYHGGNYTFSCDVSGSRHVWTCTLAFDGKVLSTPASFFISTHRPVELAQAMGQVVFKSLSKASTIAKLAKDITRDCLDRKSQASRLYEWVSANIVHLRRPLAKISNSPSSPITVLAVKGGDSRDHVILLGSLLQASQILFEPVMVANRGQSHAGPVATLSGFDGVCIWLPEFGIYLDTTSMCRFGDIPLPLRNRIALHASLDGNGRVAKIPENREVVRSDVEIDLRLKGGATFMGVVKMTGTGALGTLCRQRHKLMLADGTDQAAPELLYGETADGADRHSFTLSFKAVLMDRHVSDGFAPPVGEVVLPRPGDFLLGSLWADVQSNTAFYSGCQRETILLRLENGVALAALPDGVAITSSFATYASEWSVADDIVTVSRVFTSSADGEALLQPDTVQRFLNTVRADYGQVIRLVRSTDHDHDKLASAQ